jgi:integrase
LRKCANDQLSLVRLLNLKEGGGVLLSQIEAVTAIWSQPKARRCDRSASPKARIRFVNRAVQWLRFLGWLNEAEKLGKLVRDRLDRIGITSGPRGTHALRHATAQHLLDKGMSMKVIGDFLGHRDPSSTAIYAKVNLAALREVAALDLEGLA